MFTKLVLLQLCSIECCCAINESQEWKNNSDFFRSYMTTMATADNTTSPFRILNLNYFNIFSKI